MKILYTLGNFEYSGLQIIFYDINAQNKSVTSYQKQIDYTFAPALGPLKAMFQPLGDIDPAEPPATGDVVWTQTNGNQYIAHGILKDSPDDVYDLNALRLVMRSIRKKAILLKQEYIAMPVIAPDDDINLWRIVYPIVEQELYDIQPIVYVPIEDRLLAVLEVIGGDINAYEHAPLEIRFTKSQNSDK